MFKPDPYNLRTFYKKSNALGSLLSEPNLKLHLLPLLLEDP